MSKFFPTGADGGKESADSFLSNAGPNQMQRYIKSGGNLNMLRPVHNAAWIKEYEAVKADAAKHLGGDLSLQMYLRNNPHAFTYDAIKEIDTVVVETYKTGLPFVNSLLSSGRVKRVANIGKTFIQWNTSSDMTGAKTTMEFASQTDNDRIVYDLESMPLPLVHKSFSLGMRELMAGDGVDTDMAMDASYRVARKVEQDALGNGLGNAIITVGGNALYGALEQPNKFTGTLTADWLNASADPVQDIIDMKTQQRNAGILDPLKVGIPEKYSGVLDQDYTTDANAITILERMLKIPGIASVEVFPMLPSVDANAFPGVTVDNVMMYADSSRNVDVVQGSPLQTLPWEEMGGIVRNWMIYAIMPVRWKPDYNGTLGLSVWSKAPA